MVEYLNQSGGFTHYWIAIKNIFPSEKRFLVDAFNIIHTNKDANGIIETVIYFDNIQSAEIVENSSYDQPEELLEVIARNIDNLNWLGYDSYNDETLDYIKECMIHEEVAFQGEVTLVSGVDQDELEKIKETGEYKLNLEQVIMLVSKLETLSKQHEERKYEIVTLAINYLSIYTKRGYFIVAYKLITFDPKKQSLVLGKDILFNYDFANPEIPDFKHNLRNYLDVEMDEFTELFIKDRPNAVKMLFDEVRKRREEKIEEKPYIFELRRRNTQAIEKEINHIKLMKAKDLLETPLEAFFGNMNQKKLKRVRHVDVVLLNDQANINQLRVIYNALIQPITYVQGPPGTGKTATIMHILISAFFNNQKVLVSSSNNKPINDIFEKISEIENEKGRLITLPFLRVGNNDENLKTLNNLKEFLGRIKHLQTDDEKLKRHEIDKRSRTKQINYLLQQYEKGIELEEQIDALMTSIKVSTTNLAYQVLTHEKLSRLQIEYESLEKIHENDIKKLLLKVDPSFYTWLFFTSIKHFKRLFTEKYSNLLAIINNDNDDARIKEFNNYLRDEKSFKNLQEVFPVILTTNHSAHKLGPPDHHFDLAIIDEAGQCSIGPSLYAMARARRLLLVGDHNQLKPVIAILPETNKVLMKKYNLSSVYDYVENSILTAMKKVDVISKDVLLREHYRSRKKIIDYSNKKYYSNLLILKDEPSNLPNALVFIDCPSNINDVQNEKNIAPTELRAIIADIKASKYKDKKIGIITPFRNQTELIRIYLEQEKLSNVDVGTIHTFQGDQKDIIYFSAAVTAQTRDRTFDWLKNNHQLINVAITRAREKLVVVTDYNEIMRRSTIDNALFEMVRYVKNNGIGITITPAEENKYLIGGNFKNYSSEAEKEFFETIQHILTHDTRFKVKEGVAVSSIFSRLPNTILHEYGLKAEFDFVVFRVVNKLEIPVLIIELDGDEHTKNDVVIRRDKLKEEICRKNGIILYRIHNDYARRYMYIKPIIFDLLNTI